VGCSGNFTFEQLVSRYSKPRAVHSNDVSLYSTVIGAALCGQEIELRPRSEEWGWLEPYLADACTAAATVVLLLEFLKYDPTKTDYQRRLHGHYRRHWDDYWHRSAEQLGRAGEHLKVDTFWCGDVFDFFRAQTDPDTVFLSFMPTYKGGYESSFKRLEAVIAWSKPDHPVLDDRRRDEIYRWLAERPFLLFDDRRLDLPLVFVNRKGGEGRDVYAYSNMGFPPALVRKRRRMEVQRYRFLGPEDRITPGTRFDFLPVGGKVINYYREMFLAKQIDFAEGSFAFLVFADGRLFGFVLVSLDKFGARNQGLIYVMSDFVVPYSRYARLSKLLLFLLTTDRVRRLIEEKFWSRFRRLRTTAFTDKPVSSKYRGVFDLEKRGEGFLNYSAELGTRTVKKALNEWLARYART